MKLEDFEIYNISMEVGDEIWFSVVEWENLAKYSIGHKLFEVLIQLLPIFPKDLEDIISKTVKISCFMPEAHITKQLPGSQKQETGKLSVMSFMKESLIKWKNWVLK